MILKTVFVRFYKSSNFDYLRKHHPKAQGDPWEMIGAMWYPFVSVSIEPDITTIVGANESGKSHLLTAIEKGISGKGLSRKDFCRYSQFFVVEEGKMRLPDFGFEFVELTDAESEAVRKACKLSDERVLREFLLFRFNGEKTAVYLRRADGGAQEYVVPESALDAILPRTFRINANVALPSSVPIQWLATDENVKPELYERLGRAKRSGLFDAIVKGVKWFTSAETVTKSAEDISEVFSEFTTEPGADDRAVKQRHEEYELARDLIRKVAKIDKEAIEDLHDAIKNGNDGHANGIKEKINIALANALNFPKWWAQDRDFKLTVSPRELDLAFTIRDRTETEYSFGERSEGLKYFLSYYVQYLAHDPSPDRDEILLMDEPDAYLSAQAQQDMLRIFDAFARTEDGRPAVQVIYVTHSPFLIDKNHAARIRVLEKGSGEEGTRVVHNASQNHYEPLRSAFGAFVGEMAFIGNCNLMVEGTADQILLGGAAVTLQRLGATDFETLDLNKITIVPAGSASHIPYLVFLARGRDIEQPAVIVLLDSDTSGNTAVKDLKRGGPRKKQVLPPEYILQVGDLVSKLPAVPSGANSIWELEDLIPSSICVDAARRYIKEYCEKPEWAARITPQSVSQELQDGQSIFKALERLFTQIDPDLHLDKIGFARQVGEAVSILLEKERNSDALKQYDKSMRVLFRKLSEMQRKAVKDLLAERVGRRVERTRDSFLKDFPTAARREQVLPMLDEIKNVLDNTPEADAIRIELQRIRRDFKFDEDLTEPVPDYPEFVAALKRISYAGILGSSDPTAAGAPPSAAEKAASIMDAKNIVTDVKPDPSKTAAFDAPSKTTHPKPAS